MGYRIYYANQSVTLNGTTLDGVQSVGVSTTYNREPLFQLGQSTVFLDQEDLADVEVTISRLMLNTPMYILAMGGTATASGKSLASLQNQKASVVVHTYDDTSGAYITSQTMSNMYVSNISYTIPIDGNATEDITLVGNTASTAAGSGSKPGGLSGQTVKRRQHVVSSPSGAQNVTFSVDLSREPLYAMGQLEPTVRLLTFPVECTAEVEYLAGTAGGGDASISSGCGNYSAGGSAGTISVELGCSSGSSSGGGNVTISIGSAVVTSVNYSGGDAGGGNATETVSYRSYNDFTVTVA